MVSLVSTRLILPPHLSRFNRIGTFILFFVLKLNPWLIPTHEYTIQIHTR